MGTKCAVVFHDANPFQGSRLRDQLRTNIQILCMRQAYRAAQLSIYPIPLDAVSWLPEDRSKAFFIPIGSNLPECSSFSQPQGAPTGRRRVAIFGVTEHDIASESFQIHRAVIRATKYIQDLEVVLIGRGSGEAQPALQRAFAGSNVRLSVLGVLTTQELAQYLASSDVLLFVRGSISIRRGTVIAAISCGLPVVGYSGPETDSLVQEAGVKLAPERDVDALGDALTDVLCDEGIQSQLRERNKRAYANHFSWDKIAEKFAERLSNA